MKKQSIFTMVTLVAVLVFTSCNKFEPKEVKLSTVNDSLNYTLGLANGDGIKSYYMQNDSTDQPMIELLKALDKAYKGDANEDEMYKLGLQIGGSFKQQKKQGLMGDSTLVFDTKMVRQGLVNALNDYKEGMTAEQAEEYIRVTMMAIQEKKMGQQAPPPAMPDSVPAQ
ncbi:MAG TPA: FKBP-type peptidyl-prolyl cis-trans isomerase N-terminal domain-containing protein [Paludibacter sp.]|nr:FKBP-type peptidyl-prolyl cis-trans isomerase N-terminal domain-containing protein [Paludibacter sp.]